MKRMDPRFTGCVVNGEVEEIECNCGPDDTCLLLDKKGPHDPRCTMQEFAERICQLEGREL